MVMFIKENPDGTAQPVWRGVKRKLDVEGERVFEFDRKSSFKDKKRHYAMYMVQDLPAMPCEPGQNATDLTRSTKNRNLAGEALKEVDALDPYVIKLEHCKSIYAPDPPRKPGQKRTPRSSTTHAPVEIDQVFLNRSSGSLIQWMLAMFEDQSQLMRVLTGTMSAANAGPYGTYLASRPVDLHDEVWKCASRWMDLRVRQLTQATKVHFYNTRGGAYNHYSNAVDQARHAVSDDERKTVMRNDVGANNTSVELRITQINSLVHGGDLEGDLTLMRSWDQLGMAERSTQLRKEFFAACWSEWYGQLTDKAADMIGTSKPPPSPSLSPPLLTAVCRLYSPKIQGAVAPLHVLSQPPPFHQQVRYHPHQLRQRGGRPVSGPSPGSFPARHQHVCATGP